MGDVCRPHCLRTGCDGNHGSYPLVFLAQEGKITFKHEGGDSMEVVACEKQLNEWQLSHKMS